MCAGGKGARTKIESTAATTNTQAQESSQYDHSIKHLGLAHPIRAALPSRSGDACALRFVPLLAVLSSIVVMDHEGRFYKLLEIEILYKE